VIGSDYNGIGEAVTAQAPATDGGADPRTAEDAGCIN
jgi:hypothetical protein